MERRLLFLLCVLVLGRAAVLNHCRTINTLQDKLLYNNRVLYMKEYFPINYKLYVEYEEVLGCQNITTLISKGITVKELRYLWGIVNESVLQTIQRALLERHPTRPFIKDLQGIFNVLLRGTTEEEIKNDEIVRLVDKLYGSEDKVKAVTPKSLLDNCNRVLYALYEEDCQLGNSRSEDTLCPPESLPEPSSQE